MFKITHSLLSSWLYATSDDAGEDAFESFLSTLRGERTEPTEAMLDGRRFEDLVNRIVLFIPRLNEAMNTDSAHELDMSILQEPGYNAARQIAEVCVGGQPQVKIEKDVLIRGTQYRLVGVLDYLKAGVAYDIKRPSYYEYGKYQDSTQHPMYFRLVPDATRFEYLIYDGSRLVRENYWRDETPPIEPTITQFMDFLKAASLIDVYAEHWSVT